MKIRNFLLEKVKNSLFKEYILEDNINIHDYFINNSIMHCENYKFLSAAALSALGYKNFEIFEEDRNNFDRNIKQSKTERKIINCITERKILLENLIITYDCESLENVSLESKIILCSKDEFLNFLIKIYNSDIINFINSRKNSLRKKLPKMKNLLFKFLLLSFLLLDHFLLKSLILLIFFCIFFILINCYKFLAIYFSFKNREEDNFKVNKKPNYFHSFDIFCPLYKDPELVENIFHNIYKIDYPKNKINVIFIVEEGDMETIETVISLKSKYQHFNLITVPDSFPKTKPKALNYALLLSNSEIICIFDVEDYPDKNQLLIVNEYFNQNQNTDIIQCKLKYYNRNQNFLTLLFDAEYRFWFNHQLVGLSKISKICPLGGTSNYIKREILDEIGGWDAYNVTEDLGLSIEVSMINKKVKILDLYTLEESPYQISNFVNQRTRWVKGYMLSYAKYFKYHINPKNFQELKNSLNFHFIIGINAWYFFISSLLLIFYKIKHPYFFILLIVTQFCQHFIMIFQEKIPFLEKILILTIMPIYFFLHHVASFLAFLKISTEPYKWEKTKHGIFNKIFNKF